MQADSPFVFDLMNCKALPYLLHLCACVCVFLFLLLLLLFICCRFSLSRCFILFRFYYNFNAFNLNYCNVDFDHQFHNFFSTLLSFFFVVCHFVAIYIAVIPYHTPPTLGNLPIL